MIERVVVFCEILLLEIQLRWTYAAWQRSIEKVELARKLSIEHAQRNAKASRLAWKMQSREEGKKVKLGKRIEELKLNYEVLRVRMELA